MTKEDRELLLKDLCARLPYRVLVQSVNSTYPTPLTASLLNNYSYMEDIYCKPYLRPMSSMTDEERKEYESLIFTNYHHSTHTQYIEINEVDYYIDWLNSKHFDYRNLIEKKLALEAPEGMYN